MVMPQIGWGIDQTAVLHTIDGGRRWQTVTPRIPGGAAVPTAGIAADFVDARDAWVAVPNSLGGRPPTAVDVWRTADAGRHWQRRHPIPAGGVPSQLTFIDQMHGWVVIGYGVAAGSIKFAIYRTTDGAAHWTRVLLEGPDAGGRGGLPYCDCSQGFAYNTASEGWAAGCYCGLGMNPILFFHSTDGGRRWRPYPLRRPARFRSSATSLEAPIFLTRREGVLPVYLLTSPAGAFFDAYHTADGGRTWNGTTPLRVQSANEPESFVDTRHGFLLDGRRLDRTSDGGRHWQSLPSRLSRQSVIQLDFVTPSIGFAIEFVGGSGRTRLLASTDGGRTWHQVGS